MSRSSGEVAPTVDSVPEQGTALGPAWHALDIEEVLARLGSGPNGLDPTEAAHRLEKYGRNRLPAPPPKSAWAILWDQVRSVVMALLAGAMVVSWLTGDHLEAAAIGAVVLINAAIGFVTEFRARQAIRALARLQAETASVLRAAAPMRLPAEELVPGDVVALEEGDRIPADLRLIDATGLRVDEAILTGESVPVVKHPTAALPEEAPLHARTTMAYQGSAVVGGSALGVVAATASRTAVGRIGELLESTPDEETPLERKLDELGQRLIGITLGLAAVVAIVGGLRGIDWAQTFKTGIALAVAAVPEGLPAIATIALAIGVRRIAKRRALVRRLPSVETLGSVTVVCTDKTGTLTTGHMRAARHWTPDDSASDALVRAAALANRAVLGDGKAEVPHYDPTEAALLEFAAERAEVEALRAERPRIGEIPFSASTRMMASLHAEDGSARWYAKGAPESILERCTEEEGPEGARPLTGERKAKVLALADEFAGEGLRVLGFARSHRTDAPPETDIPTDPSQIGDLVLLGMVGLIDPPAERVPETVRDFRDAGIRVLMLTGDHRFTAAAIAEAVGIGEGAVEAVDLSERTSGSLEGLPELLRETSVFARVSPEQKLDIIRLLQDSGEVVAMLGDGVNDAAALKRADVGVAMGKRGAEVARQASDIVLQDDRFESVAAAVAEGRVVFSNIRKFGFYLFSCNLAEVLVLLAAGVVGWPLPLLPLQILWLNLVTDTFPALALAFEPPEDDLMRRPPRPPAEPILGRDQLASIFAYGIGITVVTLVATAVGLERQPGGGAHAMTLTFATLALAQVFHLGNARGRAAVLAPHRVVSNRFALGGAGLSIVLLVLALHLPALQLVLGVEPLGVRDWLLVSGLAALPAVLGQGIKLFRERGGQAQTAAPLL